MTRPELQDVLPERPDAIQRQVHSHVTLRGRMRHALVAAIERPKPAPVEAVLLWLATMLMDVQRLVAGPGTGLALVYHRLADVPGDPKTELLPALSVDHFGAHLRLIGARYRVVAAGELPAAARRRRRGERLPIAVTFDDDDPGHVRWAAPALRASGLPATFFLCGASLDQPHAFWWEHLQLIFDRGLTPPAGLPQELFAAAAAIVSMPPDERDRVDAEMGRLLGDDPPETGLRRDQVVTLARDFEIGFHTADHHPLDTLDDERLRNALSAGRENLESAIGRPCTVIAYPNGRSDGRTAAAVEAAGFDTGFTTQARPLRGDSDCRLIGRLEGRAGSLGVFALRLALLTLRRGATREG